MSAEVRVEIVVTESRYRGDRDERTTLFVVSAEAEMITGQRTGTATRATIEEAVRRAWATFDAIQTTRQPTKEEA